MADRTSAALFSDIFEQLAASDNPDLAAVKKFWQQTWNYDFNHYQMSCDDALIKLGLAKNHRDANGDEYLVYANSSADGWEDE
jgi:hypothetical protein